jgi:hypothetical protein
LDERQDAGLKTQRINYDRIVKAMLFESDALTIAFVNGLFGSSHPPGSAVLWLDKESVNAAGSLRTGDAYVRIESSEYCIEIEAVRKSGMSGRLFGYAVGGAMRHSASHLGAVYKIRLPRACAVFLKGGSAAPEQPRWIARGDGGRECEILPRPISLHLSGMGADEIEQRGLLPAGQFLLRTLEPLTNANYAEFARTASGLLRALRRSQERGAVPLYLALGTEKTICAAARSAIIGGNRKGDLSAELDSLDNLSWASDKEVI